MKSTTPTIILLASTALSLKIGAPGDFCRKSGWLTCDNETNGKTFLTCDHNRWVERACGEGTICQPNGKNSITCGWGPYEKIRGHWDGYKSRKSVEKSSDLSSDEEDAVVAEEEPSQGGEESGGETEDGKESGGETEDSEESGGETEDVKESGGETENGEESGGETEDGEGEDVKDVVEEDDVAGAENGQSPAKETDEEEEGDEVSTGPSTEELDTVPQPASDPVPVAASAAYGRKYDADDDYKPKHRKHYNYKHKKHQHHKYNGYHNKYHKNNYNHY